MDYEMFACDWVRPGSTHEQGYEQCVEALTDALRSDGVPAERAAQRARRTVDTWGNLSREAE